MKLNITKYNICSDKFSCKFDKLRIAVLSDLHDTVHGEDNARLFELIYNEKPDIVIIAGDLVTARRGRDYSPALVLLKRLAENWPVYYGLGNHEQKLKEDSSAYIQKIKAMPGVIFLDNESIDIKEYGISVIGLSLPKKFYKKGRKILPEITDIKKAIGEKADMYTVLIAHNPVFFETYAEWGAELIFSGHLHGGIVRLPFVGGVLSPQVRFFPKYDKGMFKRGESTMIVSAGLGKHTIPVRLWNPAELLIIDLKNKN